MKKTSLRFWIVFIASCIVGFILGRIDSSPKWDDTGIMVAAILFFSFLFGAIFPRYAWLWAIIIGSFILGFDIVFEHNYQSAFSIIFAMAGSYAGAFFRRKIISVG
jgi:hypothetical protein